MRALVAAATCLVLLAACEREQRRFAEVAPSAGRPDMVRLSPLTPGGAAPAASPRGPYGENAWAVSEGKRLFQAYNCNGCHANGGGGMGPPLMDAKWLYGSEPENVYATIVEGRPNGMPAFGGKIPDQQLWELVAYVRSMSGLLRADVRPSRDDHMQVMESEQARRPQPPTSATPPGAEPRR
ncbi:MAG TPA: c-type cytochrome [Methylomirabilota bacterium]|jgi:cytochrome c oxidase cbb3-type subunit 3|nr:c-type cytochrome [Methylomirabilota bacterium]